jgi:hypothetical protein
MRCVRKNSKNHTDKPVYYAIRIVEVIFFFQNC